MPLHLLLEYCLSRASDDRFIEHHPHMLMDRDDVPDAELDKYITNTTEVLSMIEVRSRAE